MVKIRKNYCRTRSNRVDKDALMSHLFATTDLQKNVRVNLNVIGLSGRPKVFDLREILKNGSLLEHKLSKGDCNTD